MRIFLTIISLFLTSVVFAQAGNKDCHCSRSQHVTEGMSYRIFRFSKGSTIAICGYKDKDSTYSEFVLYNCMADSDIRFYDVLQRCKVHFTDDTLTIENIEPLAIGKEFEFIDNAWLIEHYYYNNNMLRVERVLNKRWFYTPAQVQSALFAFEHTQWKTQTGSSETESKYMMKLAGRLMIAAISGNQPAMRYFIDFKDRFKPDGANAEWYDTMSRMIKTAEDINRDRIEH